MTSTHNQRDAGNQIFSLRVSNLAGLTLDLYVAAALLAANFHLRTEKSHDNNIRIRRNLFSPCRLYFWGADERHSQKGERFKRGLSYEQAQQWTRLPRSSRSPWLRPVELDYQRHFRRASFNASQTTCSTGGRRRRGISYSRTRLSPG